VPPLPTTVNQGNVFFENDGHGNFKDVTEEAGLGLVAHSSGSMFLDYDNDGLVDLLVCNVGVYTSNEKGHYGEYVGLKDAFLGHLYPERFEYPVLYKNLGHYKFKDVTAEVGLRPYGWCGDATFADVNGDSWPDVFFLNMQGASHYFENVEGKKFVEKTQEYFPRTPWGSVGLKFFDYDNDGRMDLFTNAASMRYSMRRVIDAMQVEPNDRPIAQRHQSKTKPVPTLECHPPISRLALARSLSHLCEKSQFRKTGRFPRPVKFKSKSPDGILIQRLHPTPLCYCERTEGVA